MRTPLYRTLHQVPKVSPIEGFHCNTSLCACVQRSHRRTAIYTHPSLQESDYFNMDIDTMVLPSLPDTPDIRPGSGEDSDYKEDFDWFSVFMMIGALFLLLPTTNLASQNFQTFQLLGCSLDVCREKDYSPAVEMSERFEFVAGRKRTPIISATITTGS